MAFAGVERRAPPASPTSTASCSTGSSPTRTSPRCPPADRRPHGRRRRACPRRRADASIRAGARPLSTGAPSAFEHIVFSCDARPSAPTRLRTRAGLGTVRRERRSAHRQPRRRGLATVSHTGGGLERLGLADDEFAAGSSPAAASSAAISTSRRTSSAHAAGRAAEVEEELMRHAIDASTARARPPHDRHRPHLEPLLARRPDARPPARRPLRHGPHTDKYHLIGVGCASAVPLLRLAAQALNQHPHKQALVVAAESMSSILMSAGERPEGQDGRLGDLRRRLRSRVALQRRRRRRADDPRQPGPPAARHAPRGQPRADARDSYLHLARELPDLAAAGLRELVRSSCATGISIAPPSTIGSFTPAAGASSNAYRTLSSCPTMTPPPAGTRSPTTAISARPRSSTCSATPSISAGRSPASSDWRSRSARASRSA